MIKWFKNLFKKEKKKEKVITYQRIDDKGTVEVMIDGKPSGVTLATFKAEDARKLLLYADGKSTKEVNSILQKEKREKRLNQVLGKDLPPSE